MSVFGLWLRVHADAVAFKHKLWPVHVNLHGYGAHVHCLDAFAARIRFRKAAAQGHKQAEETIIDILAHKPRSRS